MADLSQKTALALSVQSAVDTYNAPTSDDIYPIANLRPQINGVTLTNPEYTGTVHRKGDDVVGKTVSLSFTMLVRGPGGTTPPSAGDFIPGRILRAAGFTEVVTAAAIPAAAEALSAAETDGVTLGEGATGTADLYTGLSLNLAANGTAPKSLTAIASYSATKEVGLAEVFAAAPTGNYQIPPQLSYLLSADESSTFLSGSFWLGSVRYNALNLAVSALRVNFVAATIDQPAYSTWEVTLTGYVQGYADEAAPAVPSVGAAPLFKDGDFWVANVALGGSSFSIDLGLRLGYPPNPNKADGNDAPQITQTTRTVSLTLNQQLKATIDLIGMADDQTYHPVWGQFGRVKGNIVSALVPEARFNFPSPDPSGDFVTETVDMLIDGADKSICISFPYPA